MHRSVKALVESEFAGLARFIRSEGDLVVVRALGFRTVLGALAVAGEFEARWGWEVLVQDWARQD